ncbi:MAG: Ig-like domain-containing protein, partial [Aeromonas veronii]
MSDGKIILAVVSDGKTRLISADASNAVKVKLVNGNKYILKNVNDDFAPENVTLLRVGDELHIIQEGDSEASIIIDDYFLKEDDERPVLMGMAEDGQLYVYVPTSGEAYETGYVVTDGNMSPVSLGGEPVGLGSDVFSRVTTEEDDDSLFGLLGWLAAAGAAGGIGAIIHQNNKNDDKPSEPQIRERPEPPALGSALDNTGAITGPIQNGTSTDETRPALSGNSTPGSTVTIYDNGNKIGSVVVDQNGSWTFTPEAPLGEGQHAITITETDKAGNESAPSESINFVVDTVAPAQPAIEHVMDKVGDVTGEIFNGNYTDDSRPELSGIGEAGSTITVYDNGMVIGTTEVNEDGRWFFVPANALTDGLHSISVTQTDRAGNVSPASDLRNFNLLTSVPAQQNAPDATDNTGLVTGPITPGSETDETKPTISGQGTPGNTIIITDNGTKIGTVEVDENGNWSLTPDRPLTEGEHSLTVVEKNQAGNTSTPSAPIVIVVDTTAPEQAGNISITDNVGDKQGPVVGGETTDDRTPTLTGTAEPGSTVKVIDNG